MEHLRRITGNRPAPASARLIAVTRAIGALAKGAMSHGPGGFWLRCGLVILATLGAGCRRHTVGKTVGTTASANAPAGATTLPTTRAAGEFVQSPRRVVFDAAEVRVPIELVTFTPVVAFTSADGVRRRMTLDTGADAVLLTPGCVAAAGLATRPSNRSHRDASGTWGGTPVAMMDQLELGGIRFEDFDADVVGLHIGSDALLGWPLWRDVLLTIDYPRQMLILKRGSLPVPDGKRVLPLRLEHDQLMVEVTLDGRAMWMNLDTGYGSGDSVDLSSARAAELAWASPAVPTVTAHTPGGAVGQKVGRLNGDLILGRYRFVQPVAGTNAGIAVDILSAWALANFTLTLDLRNMRAQFDRADESPIRTGPVFVAGFDCDLTSQPLKVTGILPSSDAERAGLRVGDLLLTIDGRPALEAFLSHTGGPYAVELQRGDRKTNLTIPMTRLVP